MCCSLLSSHFGIRAETLSTDDLYLDFDGLQALAARFPDNGMLQGRGLPGSHDVLMGKDLLQRIIDVGGRSAGHSSSAEEILFPVFDKSAHAGFGDRSAAGRNVRSGFDVLLFEGWSQGFMPQGVNLRNHLKVASLSGQTLEHANSHPVKSLEQVDAVLQRYVRDWYGYMQAFVRVGRAREHATNISLRSIICRSCHQPCHKFSNGVCKRSMR